MVWNRTGPVWLSLAHAQMVLAALARVVVLCCNGSGDTGAVSFCQLLVTHVSTCDWPAAITLVSAYSHHARHWSHHRISGVDCTAPQGPTNRQYGPVTPRAAGPSVSYASPPPRPAPSRCLHGRPSSVLRPDQTVPLSHSKLPAAPHVFPCPHSFGPLHPLTRQTGPHVHCVTDLAQDGDLPYATGHSFSGEAARSQAPVSGLRNHLLCPRRTVRHCPVLWAETRGGAIPK